MGRKHSRKHKSEAKHGDDVGTDQLISVLDVIRIVRQHWLIGVGCALIVSVTVGVLLSMQQPQYSAQASLVVELDAENIIDVGEVVNTGIGNPNLMISFMNTHLERLRSRSMADAVVDALEPEIHDRFLEGYIGSLEAWNPKKKLPNAAGLLFKQALEVNWGRESQAIRIIITHSDPLVAQTLANEYVNQYIQYKAKERSKSTSDAVSFLGQQVEELREQLAASEMKLQEYRKEKNIVTAKRGESVISQKLSQWNVAVTDARVRLLVAQSRLNQVELAGGDLEKLMNIPFVGGRKDIKAIYAQLQELRREFQVLDDTYLKRHPKIVENDASQNAVNEALWLAIEQARQEVSVDYDTIKGELNNLEQRLVETNHEALQVENDLIYFRALERQVESMRVTYETLSGRYSETTIAERMNLNTIRALDLSVLPSVPKWPDPKKIALTSMFLGGIFFLGVPLCLELLDFRVKNFSDIETYVGKQLIGHIRDYPDKTPEALAQAVINMDEDLEEPFRAIYSGLRLKLKFGRQPISLVLTSSMPSEGKSFIASNLASTFAVHKYRVLLIDCDLRRPTLHNYFNKKNDAGLIQWVSESEAIPAPESIVELQGLGIMEISKNLDFLCSGGGSHSPTEILSSPRFSDLIKALQGAYDVIILDTPPVGLFPDATIVADHASATVFVTRQNLVSRQKVRYSVGVLEQTDAPVVGVVFNRITDVKTVVGYGHYGSSYYGYGFEKDADQYKEYYSQERDHG